MLAPLPGAWPERPGSATLPFFGVVPLLVDDKARGRFLQCCWDAAAALHWLAGPAPALLRMRRWRCEGVVRCERPEAASTAAQAQREWCMLM